ncbi:MAG: response regulator, partial [Candidatus Hydrogenedentes bacterium]|nr:response regulator [Candidatus Hydrogenedentota bacterium]
MEQEHAARRILVADDEEMVATSLARMIHRRFGCPVDTVPDGDAVIHALESQSYDVLITDMAMPGIHGAELVAAVVKLRPTLDVMVVTAFPREFPYMEVIDAGATDFIIKPCAQEELAAKLLRILKERTLREALAEEKRRILEDMEALRQARAAQAYAEEKYRSLFEFSMNGMLLLEPNGLSVVDVNQTFCELSGRTRDEVLTRPIFELFGPEHGERLKEGLGAFVEARRGTLADITLQHPSGRTAILDVSVVFLEIGRESIGLVTLKDVTEQRELQRQLAERALSDTLTGLYNQGAFHTKLRGAIAWARRHKQPLSLIFLDVDNFKTCNDTYGHQAGDELLHRVGDVI